MMTKVELQDILIVDDDSITRRVLIEMLSKSLENVKLHEAKSGMDALEKIKSSHYHLILLDVQMPEMDGYEVCQKLKSEDETKLIPVIFLTGQTEPEEVIKGFDSGAVDYLVKPVNYKELSVRVRTHLEMSQIRRQLEKYAKNMEAQVKDRTKQLMHAERMSSLGVMAAGVAHEINNPTSFISGNVQTLVKFWPFIQKALEESLENKTQDEKKIKFILEEIPKMTEGMKNGVRNISKIVQSLKSYSRQDDMTFEECDLKECIQQALLLCKNLIKYNVKVEEDLDTDTILINGDQQKLVQVLVNLITNSKDAMGEAGGVIRITSKTSNDHVTLVVEDTGPGFKEEHLTQIWQPFFTTKGREKGTGLGLSITHGIIEEHKGNIKAENRDEGGARFIIELPKKAG